MRKTKKYDVILVYEHKVREIESLCLLKTELEVRGYSVLVKCIHDLDIIKCEDHKCRPLYHAKVLGVFACYYNKTLQFCVSNAISFEKVIDLQWEQMIANNQENATSFRNFSEIGKEVIHIAWGEANRRRLIERAGIPERQVFVCGNISLDFLNPKFDEYYKSREEVCEEFGLDSKKKICILFANYRGADLSDAAIEQLRSIYPPSRIEVLKLGKQTKEKVLEWFVEASEQLEDCEFIYRPHPGENVEYVARLFIDRTNMHIISDYSSKQWIKIADRLFSWHSTVVIESFLAEKKCYSLEPYGYIREEDNDIFLNMNGIVNYSDFIGVLRGEEKDIQLNEHLINDIFGKRMETPSYTRLADCFSYVLKADDYILDKSQELARIYCNGYDKMVDRIYHAPLIYDVIIGIKFFLCRFPLARKWNKGLNALYGRVQIAEKECVSMKEMENIQNRIKKVLTVS